MDYKNFAFISYSHRDITLAKWLQRRLERYKLPTEIHNEIDAECRYLRPVFRDQSDLNTGVLGDELRKNLEESKYLILICSKSSAQSHWVSNEARAFIEMGRLDRIIPVIIPVEESNERELFPTYLRTYFKENPGKELLGVNIGEVGKEMALIRVVSRMLNVSFDSLWKRHQRQKWKRMAISMLCGVMVLMATYLLAIPITVHVRVLSQSSSLPEPEEIILNVNGGEYTSTLSNPRFEEIRLPGYRRFFDTRIIVSANFFVPIDTAVHMGLGIWRNVDLSLKRDNSFAVFRGTVYDEDMAPLSDVEVLIAGFSSTTNSNGVFNIIVPLERQKIEQSVILRKFGYKTIARKDETPSSDLAYVMHKK